MQLRRGLDRMFHRMIFMLTVLLIGISLAGYLHYHTQKQHIRKNIQDELAAIADLKVEQIASWRMERIRNATAISKSTFAASAARQYMENPGSEQLKQEFLDWMTSGAETYNYQSVLLVDPRGIVRLSTKQGDDLDPEGEKAVKEAFSTRQPVLSELYRGTATPAINLDLVAPLMLYKKRSTVLVGAIVFKIDPRTFLYPLIKSWPGQSVSAETLLFRREGNEIVYLNELRHRQGTALTMRLPLDKKQLPAAMAIRGQRGVFEGIDYRDLPVLFAARAVPESNWLLIAKMDTSEMYAPIRKLAWQSAIIIAFLIVAASAGFYIWWRIKSSEDARTRYESELKSKILAQRYDYLSKYANDIIFLVNPDGKILEVNDRAVATYGYGRNELLRLNIRDIRTPETVGDIPQQMQRVKEHNGLVFHTVHQRKDGSTFPVEVSSRPIELNGKNFFLSVVRDITERRQAEIALINEKKRSEAIIAAIGDGVSILDPNFKILFQNQVHQDIFGDCVGKFCYEASTRVGESCDGCAAAASYKDGMIHFAERCILTSRGKIDIEITASPLKDESGNIVAGIEVVRDITARKKAEHRLASLNRCFLNFHPDPDENINRLVALCGEQLEATCALYNRLEGKILNALGQWNTPPDFNAQDTAEGHICYDVIREGSNNVCVIRDLQGTAYAKSDPNVVRYGLKTYIGKSVAFNGASVGSLCMVYQHDHILTQDDLRFLEIVASAVGVEESRKGTLGSLSKSEQRYKHLVESITDYIYAVTVENGQAVSTTHGPGCANVTGYTSAEFEADPGLWYRMIFDGDKPSVIAQTNTILSGAPTAPFEHRIIHKDGSIRWVRNTPVSRYDSEGRLIAYDGLIIDITQLMHLENQLRQAQKMEAVGQLAGGIAHDFNNILTAIIGYSHLVLMKIEEGSPGRLFVEQIISSSERAAHLTRSLLAFSRKQVMDVKLIDLNTIIKRSEHLLGRVIGEDIEFRTMLSDNELTVLADEVQIEQVLMNLAANSRDAMPNGGILLIETKVVTMGEEFIRTNSYGSPGNYAYLAVTDTGVGFDENTRSRIFEPFFTTKEVGKGTGLGLSMAYGIIKQHQGYINADSEPGKGTTFKIYLPLLATSAIEEPAAAPVVMERGGTETVLLAEDDKTVRDLAKYVLESFGYKVIEAADGEEAVQKFVENRNRIDLLLFDIIMPKKNGKAAHREIEKIRPDIRALFMSGYSIDTLNRKGVFETGRNFIMKPISPSDLLKKVRETLNRK